MSATLCFWGVRGSISASNSKYGTNTSCVELRFDNGHSIFFDAGTGIREATKGRSFKKISICLSHFHWDHIQGLPYASPENIKEVEWKFYSGFSDMKERLHLLFDQRFHPVDLPSYLGDVEMQVIEPNQKILIEGLNLELAPLNHPGKSFAFRVSSEQKCFCYATDSDYDPVPEEAKILLYGADFCVMDSQFLVGDSLAKSHYGHSSFKHAIDTAAKMNVKKVFLFHYDPNYTDEELHEIESQAVQYVQKNYDSIGLEVEMAREGHEFSIRF